MSVAIAPDHPTLALKSKIQEITREFQIGMGFNYFQYLRCHANGSISLLINFTGLVEYFSKLPRQPMVFSSYKNEYEKLHSYWFLWDEELPEYPVSLAREKFNLHNGLTLVRRSKNYYDMIAVALPKQQDHAGSFYLNKLKTIEQYINLFDKENKDLIEHVTKNPIVLPQDCRDVNYQKMCLQNGKVAVIGKYSQETYLTSRELVTLRLITQGASYKEAAQILNLSARTIETYLVRAKIRTGYSSRLEFERMLAACPV